MKKLLIGTFIFSSIVNIVSAQVTAVTNTWAPNRYLGWDLSNTTNPLFFRTNDVNRMKINGNLNYSINGFNAARNGFVLLGINNNSLADGQNIYTQKGAFSLLHLNGEGSVFQEFGYRPWMRPGITFTANSDLSYVGPRKLSTNAAEEDLTEMTLAWHLTRVQMTWCSVS